MNAAIHFLAPNPWAWALLALPALALAFWAYYGLLAPLSRPARWALWTLRGAAFLLVVFALLQPVLTLVLPDSGRPDLALLLDTSASMGLPEGDAEGSRLEAAEEASRTLQRELDGRFRIRRFTFADGLEPGAADSSLGPAGNTGIGTALEEVRTQTGSSPVSGIVLLSDGVSTVGRDPVRIASASPVPIFSVALGPSSPPADVEVRTVRTNPTAFSGEPLPVRAVLSSSGLAGRRVEVALEQDGRVLDRKEVDLLGDGLEQEITLETRPSVPGLNLYDVRVEGAADSIAQNDRRQVAVDVLERKTRILILAGRLDWDFAFLRRTLEGDTTLAYSYLVQTAPGRLDSFGRTDQNRLPTTQQELKDYAAVILTGYGEAGPPAAVRQALAGFVQQGGGLFLLGGPARPGGWTQEGDMSRLLPGRVGSDPMPSARLAPSVVTMEGQRHPATAVRENPSETARLWSALPPVWRPGGALEAKPEARVLLEYRPVRGPRLPMLAVSFHEKGKVAWLHGEGIWRWGFTTAGASAPTDLYRSFLLGLTRWLAEPAVRDRFQAAPAKRVYQNGEPVAFLASLWDDALQPVSNARVRLTLRSEADSARVVRMELRAGAESGRYDGDGPPLPPGAYRYEAEAVGSGGQTVLARSSGRFWVETMGPEYSRTWTDRQTLARISEESGGTSVEASALQSLIDGIPGSVRRVGRITERELWNDWILFAAFLLVLSVEWFLRRRRGLA